MEQTQNNKEQLTKYIQGVEYKIQCCHCGEPVYTDEFEIGDMHYACSDECFKAVVDDE